MEDHGGNEAFQSRFHCGLVEQEKGRTELVRAFVELSIKPWMLIIEFRV